MAKKRTKRNTMEKRTEMEKMGKKIREGGFMQTKEISALIRPDKKRVTENGIMKANRS